MSTEVQKPVVPVEDAAAAAAPVAPAAEPTPAVADPVESETKPVEAAVEPTAEETPKVDGEKPAAVEEKKEEKKKEEKPVEPIYSGALGYKAPGLKNIFRTSKKYFWFGEEAAVPASSLSQYLRGEKAEIAHPTVAWSSVTGKGLLFFVKHADQKQTPAGVLNLADATELTKDGPNAFYFKLHGDKHSFEASSTAERNGWFIAVEKAITEAKASKEGIVTSEAYLEEKKKLDKPALAPVAATTPKKSTEVAPKPVEGEAAAAPAADATAEDAAAPVRAGSSSSSDEEKKKKASKSKSRSASRGKRTSIFGSILGKKDKVEEKIEEKKEEKKEEKAEEKEANKEEATPAAEASAAPVAAPVTTEETPKPVEETKAEEAVAAPAAPAAEEKKTEEKPKPTKRASIFGNFVEKLKSPTHERKEPELTPVAKEPEVAAAEAPKVEETPKVEEAAPVAPAVDAVDGTTEAPKKSEEVKPATTPAKEKQHFSFGKFLGGGKDKVKSPTTDKAPEVPKTEEAPKVEETPAPVAPVEPVEPAVPAAPAAEPTTEVAKEEPAAEAAAAAPAQKKRGSIFGLGGSVKKEKDGEEKPQGLKGLFRNASKAGKTSKKEKETTSTPAKVEEAVEPTEEKTTEAAAPVAAEETPAAPASTEQAAIGDVVPDAVTVGQAPKSTPAVTSSA